MLKKKKKNGRFVCCIRSHGRGPAATRRWLFLGEEEEEGRRGRAESLTRANALAWQKPFCTTSGGANRHREALASSWHRPNRGPGA